MKVTQFGPGSFPLALAGWSTGEFALNSNSNTINGFDALNFVQRITANGSNILINPLVNFAAGSNILLTLDQGPLPTQAIPSNTIRIHSTGGSGTNLTIEEVDGSPSVAATKLVLPNGTLGVVGTVATYTPASSGGGALVYLQTQTASSSAQLDFTSFISSTYDTYIFELIQVFPVVNDVGLRMRMGTGAGPTYDTGTKYSWAVDIFRAAGSARNGVESAGDYISLNYGAGGTLGVSNTSNYNGYSGMLTLYAPEGSTYKDVRSMGRYLDAESFRIGVDQFGSYESATAVTGVRFYFSTGVMNSGIIRVYGVTKS